MNSFFRFFFYRGIFVIEVVRNGNDDYRNKGKKKIIVLEIKVVEELGDLKRDRSIDEGMSYVFGWNCWSGDICVRIDDVLMKKVSVDG